MTKENYSLSEARDLVNNLNDIVIFMRSSAIHGKVDLQNELEDLLMEKIQTLDNVLFRLI